MSFGKMLKRLRDQKGLTQKQLSGFIHISRDTYAQYEIDRRQPDFKTLQKLADYFNVSTDYLLGRTDDPTPPGSPRAPGKPLSPEARRLVTAAGHLTPRQTELVTEVEVVFMWDVVGVISTLALLAALVAAVVFAVKRSTEWKKWLKVAGISFLVAALAITMSPAPDPASDAGTAGQQEEITLTDATEATSQTTTASNDKNTTPTKDTTNRSNTITEEKQTTTDSTHACR